MFRSQKVLGFRALVPQRLGERVLSELHELGIAQFRETKLELGRRRPELRPLLDLILRLRKLLETLHPPASPLELERLPPFQEFVRQVEGRVAQLEKEVRPLLKHEQQLEEERRILEERRAILQELAQLGVPAAYLRGSERVRVWLVRIEEERVEQLGAELRAELGSFWMKSGKGKKPLVVLACMRERAGKVPAILYRLGAEMVEIPEAEAPDPLAEIQRKLARVGRELEQTRRRISGISEEARDLQALLELAELYRDRLEATSLFGYTEATLLLEGWVPADRVKELEGQLVRSSEGKLIFKTFKPPLSEEEEVPTILRNPRGVRDFELLTELYGTPKYFEVDPTPLLSLTFPLFFAICLSDAAYGVILGLLAYFSPGPLKEVISGRLRTVVLACAAVTVPVGLLVGGVFGQHPLWVSGMDNPVPLVKLSVFLGILHLLTGMLFASAKGFMRRDWLEALGNLGKAVALIGFFCLAFSILGMGLYEFGIDYRFEKVSLFDAFNPTLSSGPVHFRYLFYAGLLLAVLAAALKEKGMGRFSAPLSTVYGLAGWISDAASYTRLMALCLATGIIAFTINYLLSMAYGFFEGISVWVLWLSLPLLVIAFAFMHTANVLLNSLGGFVHTMRLHFVEFFGKFFEGGGRRFSPFKVKRRLVRLKQW